jgi:hypothetical protein
MYSFGIAGGMVLYNSMYHHQFNIAGNQAAYMTKGQFLANSDTVINGNITLSVSSTADPSAPPDGDVTIFGRLVGSKRVMPAFIGSTGAGMALQPSIAYTRQCIIMAINAGTTPSVLGCAVSAIGTATAASIAVTNQQTASKRVEYAITVASTSAIAGLRISTAQFFTGGNGGFFMYCKFGPSRGVASNATRRGFIGFTSSGAPSDAQPSTALADIIGAGHDSGDANWQIMTRTGTGTTTKVDTGFSKSYSDTTQMFELVLYTAPGSGSVEYRFTDVNGGTSYVGTTSATLPAASTLLTWQLWNSVGGTNSVIGVVLSHLYIETPK